MNNNIIEKEDLFNVLVDFLELKEDCKYDTIFEKDELDSFSKINLLVLLEEYTNKDLSIIDLFECDTIGDICELCLKEEE